MNRQKKANLEFSSRYIVAFRQISPEPSGCGSVEERLTRVRGIASSTPGTVWGFSENSILE